MTESFVSLARMVARSQSYPDLPMVIVPHPFETLSESRARQLADEKYLDLAARLVDAH